MDKRNKFNFTRTGFYSKDYKNRTQPYTYLLKHIQTGKVYYGVRYKYGCDPSELFQSYFSSSKKVEELLEKFGRDSFVYQVRKVFKNREDAVKWEVKVLRRMNVSRNPLFLNEAHCINAGRLLFSESIIKKRTKKAMATRKRNGIKLGGSVGRIWKDETRLLMSVTQKQRMEDIKSDPTKHRNYKKVKQIIELYKSKPVLKTMKIGKTNRKNVFINYERAFSHEFMKKYGFSDKYIYGIIKRKYDLWNSLY